MAPDWEAPPSPGLVVTTARVASAATHAGWQGRGIAPDLPVPTLAPAWSPLPLPWGTLARALADPPGSARGPGVLPQRGDLREMAPIAAASADTEAGAGFLCPAYWACGWED
jgi:hypothetical protein